jgi:hypothetical protein
MRRAVALLLLAVVVTASACGSGGGGNDALAERVAAVRAAAEDGDAVRARAELATLADEVTRAQEAGALDASAAQRILAAAADVEDDLGLLDTPATTRRVTTTTTTTTTSTTAVPVTPKPDNDDDHRGKGRGKRGGDDD